MYPEGMKPRVLGARRLSRVRDNSTSFERQEKAIRDVTESIGGALLPKFADDPDVSAAKVPPADRPGLGPWLQRPTEYDVIVWWRLDRAVRSMRDMSWLGGWARDNGKRLIFAEGPGGGRLELDMTSPVSELLMMVFAFAAQMEVLAIQERTAGSTEYLRSVGRWGGGRVPFGRMPVPHPTEDDGWWLGRHDDTADILADMVRMVLDGTTYHAVTAWLNKEYPGVTPANHRRKLATPPKDIDPSLRWNPGMVSSLLRQPTLRGWAVVDGKPVRDETGEPILAGVPLVDDDTWRALQAEMDSRDTEERNKSDAHPLLGVAFCGSCGGKLYQGWLSPGPNRKVAKRQYRCAAKAHGKACAKPTYVMAEPVDEFVEAEFMERFGAFEVVEEITIPGVDHRAEIEELRADVESLARQLANLRGAAADAVGRQIQGRSDKLERLEAQPVVPARTEVVPTGVSYAEAWRRAKAHGDIEGCRDLLLGVGARVTVGETYRGCRDVRSRLTFDSGTHIDPEADALEDAAYQASL